MRALLRAARIGLAVAFFSLLMWFPGEILSCGSWWQPVPCSGQESDGNIVDPENIGAVSFTGQDFAGQVSIINNTIREANGFYRVQLLNAFRGFSGIAQVNQAAGTLSNQATYIGIAGLGDNPKASGVGMSYVSRVQKNSLTTSNSTYQAHIKGASFAAGSGIALVNQAAGHLNTQLNAFNLAIGGRVAQEFTDVQLGAISSHNRVISDPDAPSVRAVELELEKGSFQDFAGIWGTSQIAGNLNQVTTVFNVRVITVP
jgi:hypothetical protein